MASIDSVLAQQSYTQIQDRPKLDVAEAPMAKATSFQDTVTKQFNSFANMSPTQILNRIQGAQTGGAAFHAINSSAINNNLQSGVIGSTIKSIRDSVEKHEKTARKALIGKASTIELLTAVTESKNTMEAMVKARDKLLEAYDKVLNMSM